MPRVTAIVASYNHEKWIAECLRSILDQTSAVDRIIFFSDGSKDRTLEIARETFGADRRVELLDALDQNRGLMKRLIEAFARVGADDVVALCSGDDAWDLRRVEVQLEHFRDQECEWSVGATQLCDEALCPLPERWDPVEEMSRWSDPRDYFGAVLATWPALPPHGWAFRGSLYHRVGGIDLRYTFEDFPLALRFARAATPRLTHDVVYRYRVLDTGWSRARSHRLAEEWARATLAQWRHRPVLALRYAADRYATAGSKALASRQVLHALRLYAASVGCWPSPLRLTRALASAVRRRSRGSPA